MESLKQIVNTLKIIGISIAGISFVVLMIKIAALTENDSLDNVTTVGFYSQGKVVENISFLRLFSESQGTF